MTETRANGYSSESTQRELSNEFQHDSVLMVFKNCCVLVLWTKVASALEGLNIAFNLLMLTAKLLNNIYVYMYLWFNTFMPVAAKFW